MTEIDLVEKLRAMREHGRQRGQVDAMTMLFGLVFHEEIGENGPSIAKAFNNPGPASTGFPWGELMATYQQIQKWVRCLYGWTPETCWIAHCKELAGLNSPW